VELGYAEALASAITGKPDGLPPTEQFRHDYLTIVSELCAAGAAVVVLTIPDPTDTAHFSTIQTAASLVKLEPSLLLELWPLCSGDLITANALNEMAFQLNAASVGPSAGGKFEPLREGWVLPAASANLLRLNLKTLNEIILQIADNAGAVVFDLYSFLRKSATREYSWEIEISPVNTLAAFTH